MSLSWPGKPQGPTSWAGGSVQRGGLVLFAKTVAPHDLVMDEQEKMDVFRLFREPKKKKNFFKVEEARTSSSTLVGQGQGEKEEQASGSGGTSQCSSCSRITRSSNWTPSCQKDYRASMQHSKLIWKPEMPCFLSPWRDLKWQLCTSIRHP